jgi:hypothetical protein
MSRGHGKVQRAILAAFAAEPDNAFLLSELCERVYPGLRRIEKKHRNAVARAAKAIPSIDHMKREVLGSELVFYDPLNVMSYATARLKSDSLGPGAAYRNNDYRPVKQEIWHGHDITSWRRYDISSDKIFLKCSPPVATITSMSSRAARGGYTRKYARHKRAGMGKQWRDCKPRWTQSWPPLSQASKLSVAKPASE